MSEIDASLYRQHVVPLHDLREHEPTLACWCGPAVDADGVVTHHPIDPQTRPEPGRRDGRGACPEALEGALQGDEGCEIMSSSEPDGERLGRQMLHAIIKQGIRGEHREDTLIGLGWALLLVARTCREVDEGDRVPSSTDLVIGGLIGKLESECDASWEEIEADLRGHGLELPVKATDTGCAALQGEDLA